MSFFYWWKYIVDVSNYTFHSYAFCLSSLIMVILQASAYPHPHSIDTTNTSTHYYWHILSIHPYSSLLIQTIFKHTEFALFLTISIFTYVAIAISNIMAIIHTFLQCWIKYLHFRPLSLSPPGLWHTLLQWTLVIFQV